MIFLNTKQFTDLVEALPRARNPLMIAVIAGQIENLAAKLKALALREAMFEVKQNEKTVEHQ